MWVIRVDSELYVMYLMDAGIRDVVLFCLQGGETNMSQADKTGASSHTFGFGLFEANNNERKHCDRILTTVAYSSTFFRVTFLILRTWKRHISWLFDECLMLFPGEHTAHLVWVSNSYLKLQSVICQKLNILQPSKIELEPLSGDMKKGVTTFHFEEDNVLTPAGYAREGVMQS